MIGKLRYLVSLAASLVVLWGPLSCPAQYYPYTPYPSPLTHYRTYAGPAPGYVAEVHPYYYLKPGPPVIQRWEAHRRWLEYDHLQRSPLNPESTLDHLLRTFW